MASVNVSDSEKLHQQTVRSSVIAQGEQASFNSLLAKFTDSITRTSTRRHVLRLIDAIDHRVSEQLNAILTHTRLQRLEASWRGLHYLVENSPQVNTIKIRFLDVSWQELARDLDQAIDFDQSQIFRKVYTTEFDHPGGEPYGLLLGDYRITHHPQDVYTLSTMAEVATATFAPFITGADARLFGVAHFSELGLHVDLPGTFLQAEYQSWLAFRQTEQARFAAVTLPGMLMRLPYKQHQLSGFVYQEQDKANNYLWGSLIYSVAVNTLKSVADAGWFLAMRGLDKKKLKGMGEVIPFVTDFQTTDAPGLINKFKTEICLTDAQEKQLSDLGFITTANDAYTNQDGIYSYQTLYMMENKREDNKNAELTTNLQNILSVSRFAHYIKVICRDKVGLFSSASECENYLTRWVKRYTMTNDNASLNLMSRYPLKGAKIQVWDNPSKPGHYLSSVYLQPQTFINNMTISLKLVTELIKE